jgi:hypothetical protein
MTGDEMWSFFFLYHNRMLSVLKGMSAAADVESGMNVQIIGYVEMRSFVPVEIIHHKFVASEY